MRANVTLRMDHELLQKLKHAAVDGQMSLSAWITAVLQKTVSGDQAFEAARARALKRLDRGFALGGRPLGREDAHAR
jgi:hypothetical protein